ncbi:GNAT family N-acetyltransferase [uncultured Tessaracoccus sp.]|uniref:GNAT family N-acetyltransferase n=1 Tax=uncultured Tessaracoccus sp. TaxID=905023 RepID=UPI0025E3DC24|nr:GNAT family N-acetyltransferase [uncultured Tessaracoccus sp.]
MINTVRLAMPAEAADIALVQRRAWSEHPQLRGVLEQLPLEDATTVWHAAITRPALASMRVLVALGEDGVVGFVVTQPADDPDAGAEVGQIGEFVVDPDARRAGHGSRLMQAAIDTLVTDGFTVATTWVPTSDDVMREFLRAAGWGPDGAHQEAGVESGEQSVKLTRYHTAIGR